MNGIINIYKEKGYTSHDVVARLRGILKQRKIGHTGTLDPDATGVLPVCLGSATKVCGLLTDMEKIYEAVILLGRETDTQDIGGSIIKESTVTVKIQEFNEAVNSFIGEYEQLPPMYSAIKINGQKLCDLAREGKSVDRKVKTVHISFIEVLSVSCCDGFVREARIRVCCSKGTYIRTLCHDIGQKLFCGACMKELIRIKVGNFIIDDALTLAELTRLRDDGMLDSVITDIPSLFPGLTRLTVNEQGAASLINGNILRKNDFNLFNSEGLTKEFLVFMPDGRFLAIYGSDIKKKYFKPVKMFFD